jgi:hypothetical protein
MEKLEDWMLPYQLLDWAKANLNIMKPDNDMSEDEVARTMRWIGASSIDTMYVDGDKPKLGRIGINNMLTVTLLLFPKLYEEYKLMQWN